MQKQMNSLESMSIVVVDDDPVSISFIRKLLEGRGFRAVRYAGTAEGAWQLIRQQVPDLVVLDIVMPGVDGFMVCRHGHLSSSTYIRTTPRGSGPRNRAGHGSPCSIIMRTSWQG